MSLQPAPHPVPEHPETHAPLIHGACQSQTAIFQQGTVQRRFRQLRQFSRIPSERSFQGKGSGIQRLPDTVQGPGPRSGESLTASLPKSVVPAGLSAAEIQKDPGSFENRAERRLHKKKTGGSGRCVEKIQSPGVTAGQIRQQPAVQRQKVAVRIPRRAARALRRARIVQPRRVQGICAGRRQVDAAHVLI